VGHFDFEKKLRRELREAGGCLNFVLIGFENPFSTWNSGI
jgi:hypothetical protein